MSSWPAEWTGDPDIAIRLRNFMSNISEDYWCAGWLIGLEHRLWEIIQGGSRDFGLDVITEKEVNELRRLHEKAGGWWIWKGNREVFVTTKEWLALAKAAK